MCAKPYAKTSKKVSRGKRTYKRYNRYRRNNYRVLSRRISSLSKRVAGEVCKFEVNPDDYQNNLLSPVSGQTDVYKVTLQQPLTHIQSGVPWIMPINWIYKSSNLSIGNTGDKPYYNGQEQPIPISNVEISTKIPLYYNTIPAQGEYSNNEDLTTELQYRLKYIYINALFNASINASENNTDGALRVVIVKDKQPTGGSATWCDLNGVSNSRGVFNANRIDAQLNPTSVGRFKIMYDKTLRFNTINGYKPFKYYKRLSTVVRNNRGTIYNQNERLYAETNDQSPPVQRNAFYLMLFSDGLNFTYSDEAATPAASFHLFNRVAYYNN